MRGNRQSAVQVADAAVIGAGISGLTAAALLAKRGYRVVVCERDVHPGGCAAGFSRHGFRFAVGATVAMGFEPGGIHDQIYRYLGLSPQFVDVDPAMRVHLPDRKVIVATDHQRWFSELKRAFPGQERAKERFWRQTAKLAKVMYRVARRFPVMPFKHAYDVLDTLRTLHPHVYKLLINLNTTVQGKLERFGIDDPAHRAFIDGQLLDAAQTTSERCLFPNGALALDIYRYGCHYKLGGLERIAQDLTDYLSFRGSEVQFATRVRNIIHEDGVVRGLSTSRGEVHAPVVISAIPLENTAQLLTSPSETSLLERVGDQPAMWGAFTLYLGVDERTLPKDVYYYEQITDVDRFHDGGNILVSISPGWDRSRAPQGKRAITVSTHVEAERWMALAQDRRRYLQEKQKLESHLLDRVERALPHIRDGIEVFMSGSPRTFQNFTLRAGGTVGGFPQIGGAANFAAPSHRTDVKGLFLAGDTIFPGQGTIGVTVSGHNAARSAARNLAEKREYVRSQPKNEFVKGAIR
ncbi:MAG: FAD-dependent oxidoreductase [Trueperaceae bacterium]|nr:MAG: FAD-dependent oxidoreductase [Trueperaceae bacterium]